MHQKRGGVLREPQDWPNESHPHRRRQHVRGTDRVFARRRRRTLGVRGRHHRVRLLDDDDQCRLRVASHIQVHEIQSAAADDVQRLKALAGHGTDLGTWSTPKRWLVHGSRIDAIETVDLMSAALSGLPGHELANFDSRPVAEAELPPAGDHEYV